MSESVFYSYLKQFGLDEYYPKFLKMGVSLKDLNIMTLHDILQKAEIKNIEERRKLFDLKEKLKEIDIKEEYENEYFKPLQTNFQNFEFSENKENIENIDDWTNEKKEEEFEDDEEITILKEDRMMEDSDEEIFDEDILDKKLDDSLITITDIKVEKELIKKIIVAIR
jgi:hypothetical protein